VAVDHGDHFHSVVVESFSEQFGRKVAKIVDFERKFKYYVDAAWLEQQASVYEARVGGGGSIIFNSL
jgi:hypothetical protein